MTGSYLRSVAIMLLLNAGLISAASAGAFSTASINLPDRNDVIAVRVSIWISRQHIEPTRDGMPPSVDQAYDRFKNNILKRDAISRVLDVLERERHDWLTQWHTAPAYPGLVEIVSARGAIVSVRFSPGDCSRGGHFLVFESAGILEKRFSPAGCKDLMAALLVPERFLKRQ